MSARGSGGRARADSFGGAVVTLGTLPYREGGNETAPQPRAELRLPADPSAPSLARAGLAATATQLADATASILALLTSEVVTNAVRHAGMSATQEVVVRVLDGDQLRVEVLDEGPGYDPTSERTDPERTDGWGLLLIDRLSSAWGVETEGARNKVWFELEHRSAD
jgi:anti-sigma regulatory factor (Ser/Thr protein kinase)